MTAKALRVFLASLLTLALIPTAALADDGGNGEVRASYEPEGYHDEGAGEPVTDGDSWRITDGVPNNVWLEENEDAGIATFGAFSDVEDSYRATWSAVNGVGTYIDRKKPTDKGSVITVPNVLEVGVDISYFNNEKGGKYSAIDWNKMKADGITFAIIRIGDGGTNGKGFDDPWFVRNIQGAHRPASRWAPTCSPVPPTWARAISPSTTRSTRPSISWRPPVSSLETCSCRSTSIWNARLSAI